MDSIHYHHLLRTSHISAIRIDVVRRAFDKVNVAPHFAMRVHSIFLLDNDDWRSPRHSIIEIDDILKEQAHTSA